MNDVLMIVMAAGAVLGGVDRLRGNRWGFGDSLQQRASRELDLEGVVRALGIKDVRTIDPYNVPAVRQALKEATANDELSVVVFKRPCVLLERVRETPYVVTGACKACGACVSIGCPALAKNPADGTASIDPDQCIGCGQCAHYCTFNAIEKREGGAR